MNLIDWSPVVTIAMLMLCVLLAFLIGMWSARRYYRAVIDLKEMRVREYHTRLLFSQAKVNLIGNLVARQSVKMVPASNIRSILNPPKKEPK